MTKSAGGPLEPPVKDHIQLLEELLVEVKGLREHMNTVSQYVEGLSNKIEAVLNDDPLDTESEIDSIHEPMDRED